jgi:uncharacterized membrane protein YkgB
MVGNDKGALLHTSRPHIRPDRRRGVGVICQASDTEVPRTRKLNAAPAIGWTDGRYPVLEWISGFDACLAVFVEMRQPPRHQAAAVQRSYRMTNRTNGVRSREIIKTSTIDTIAGLLGRYGLVVVIGWIGALKFANYEAHQIQPLVASSPFMGWLYDIFPVYTFSALLGVFEVAAAILLALKPLSARLSILGSLMAILLFLATVSFLFTTPGVGEPAGGGFPALSLTGEFLLKDIPLLGLSFWTLADSIRAVKQRSTN